MTAPRTGILATILGLCLAFPALAQETDVAVTTDATAVEEAVDPLTPRLAVETDLNDFLWTHRAIIVFADSPADPRFREQLALFAENPEALLERDVVIVIDSDPSENSEIRQELRPRGFVVVVMTKDGAVGFRRPSPRTVRELTRGIDNFSIRQDELELGG